MKITKISYLFALCPAMLVGLTSCNKGPLPGKALTYDEAYAHALKTAPEYNYRTNLSKGATINLAIEEFTIDGKVTLPGGEPTNIRFAIPKQDDFKLYLNNEGGVKGTLQVREMIDRDAKVPNIALNSLNSVNASRQGGGGMFGGNGLYNMLFNPFFTTFTLSYAHSLVGVVSDLNIVNENFSLDGDNFYVSYSIPDLKTFSKMAEEYELRSLVSLFTIFRGTDGSVSITMSFDKYGYLSSISLKADSNDIAFIGDSSTKVENFRGIAKVNFVGKITQNIYKDSDYNSYSVIDRLGNAQFTTRKATLDEYSNMGFSSRKLSANFVKTALDYYDVILPTYGTDFVIEHPGKTSKLDKININIDGIDYRASDLMDNPTVHYSYDWSAVNSTVGVNGATNGRTLIDESHESRESFTKIYYPNEGYTFTDTDFVGFNTRGFDASILDDILKLETSDGHKHSPTFNLNDQFMTSVAKNFFTFTNDDSSIFYRGKKLEFNMDSVYQDFSTVISALPKGFVHYNFNENDNGIDYFDGNLTTRVAYANMEDGSDHGVLDLYHNLQSDGSYVSPWIVPAKGFIVNPNYTQGSSPEERELNFKIALMQLGFFVLNDEMTYEDFIQEVSIEPKGSWDDFQGFRFKLTSNLINRSKYFSENDGYHRALFSLTDARGIYDDGDYLFIRRKDIDPESPIYLDYELVADGNYNQSDCFIFNPTDGTEKGSSKITFEKVKVEDKDVDIARFEDIVVRCDNGFLFDNDSAINNMISYNYLMESSSHGEYIRNDLASLLANFAKLSKDKKELTISVNNYEGDDKVKLLNELYAYFVIGIGRKDLSKILIPSCVLPTKVDKLEFAAEEEDSNKYLNIVAGTDFTYVQILPNYMGQIHKDLQIVLDF